MALQVWLPLTKDLRNQGLSNVTVTNNGATFNSAGKLGGCYYFNRSTPNYLKITNPLTTATNGVSMAFWVKLPSNGSVNDQLVHIGNGSGWTNNRFTCFVRGGNSTLIFACGDGTNSTQYSCTSSALTLNQWTHVICLYENSKMKIYLDGVLDKEYNTTIVPSFTNVSYIGVGAGPNTTEPVTAYLNDVRIYNHALSLMEVKQLAQGLVLHYPLNRGGWGQENLLSGNNAKITTWTNYMPNSVSLTGEGYDNKYTLIKGIGGWEKIFTDAIAVTSGKTYTLSFDYSVEQNYTGYNGQFGLSICTTSQAKYGADTDVITKVNFGTVKKSKNRTSVTFVANSNTIYLVANGGNINDGQENISFYISYIKLEEGSTATPWCPNSADTLYTTLGLNGTTEYDCSGFCNNGEKIGALTYTSDTPKYQVSTHIGATNQKIHISNFPTSGFGNSYSFAWWGKRASNSPMFWGFSDGVRLNGMYQGTLWNTGDGSNNPIYKPNTTTTITAPSVKVWHHYVMTGDGSVCKLYVDGELYGQAKTYKAISGTSIYINGWDSGTTYCSDNTDMSDFRIYATALSADDVKSLYQNCATIDADGTIHGQIRS